jgi:hypothetical protein
MSFALTLSSFTADGQDIDVDAPEVEGVLAELHEVANTITLPLSALPYALSEGVDTPLSDLINAQPTDGDLRRLEAEYTAAVLDQTTGAVKGVALRFFRDETGKGLELQARVDLQDGTYPLVALVGDAVRVIFPQE